MEPLDPSLIEVACPGVSVAAIETTGQPPCFDDSVRIAAELTGSPIAAVTMVSENHQWHKATVGIALRSSARSAPFCRYTVTQNRAFCVADASADERFASDPLVTGEHHVRAYAGAPLIMPGGTRVGTICVLDTQPRDFSERELEFLTLLARQVVSQLQLEQLIQQQARDIAELRQARGEMRHMAMHDDLTGLQNRRGVIRSLEQQFTSSHPSLEAMWKHGASLLYLDLDDFKGINDTRGHEVGDRVLMEVARRLTVSAAPGQTVGRLGGDEFIMMVKSDDAERTTAAAMDVLHALQQPMIIAGETLEVEVSIGVAKAKRFGSVPELIDRADQAMYRAKRSAGQQIAHWHSATGEPADGSDRSALRFVRSSLEKGDLQLHYQPMFDLTSGLLIRREALLRWDGDGPDDLSVEGFVAAAEGGGLIGEVGSLVLREACCAAAQWQLDEPDVGVAVNVSALQVVPSLCTEVAEALTTSGLPPHLLTLELTESSILERTDQSLTVLKKLHALGVRLALDDFGTGYASMSMLCEFPLDEVKIDRQFCSDPTGPTIKVVEAATELGHSLGLSVVAEGIESRTMLARLMSGGCDIGQGYLLGRPEPLPKVNA